MIYERALKELPGSYKLWYNYLRLRNKQLKGVSIHSPQYEDLNNAYERALVFMHKVIFHTYTITVKLTIFQKF